VEETEPEKPDSDAKKRLILKIIVVLAVVVVLAVIFLTSAPADPYDTVDKIMSNPSKYEGTEIEVRGRAEAWFPGQQVFNLTGYSEENQTQIVISYNSVPSQFANGKDVVVKGLFHHNGSTYQIDVTDPNDIIVGCSSRY
jgi:cytochrome c-type biogenesis protein CcmE